MSPSQNEGIHKRGFRKNVSPLPKAPVLEDRLFITHTPKLALFWLKFPDAFAARFVVTYSGFVLLYCPVYP